MKVSKVGLSNYLSFDRMRKSINCIISFVQPRKESLYSVQDLLILKTGFIYLSMSQFGDINIRFYCVTSMLNIFVVTLTLYIEYLVSPTYVN